jgi:hypothetical protein
VTTFTAQVMSQMTRAIESAISDHVSVVKIWVAVKSIPLKTGWVRWPFSAGAIVSFQTSSSPKTPRRARPSRVSGTRATSVRNAIADA